MSRFQWINGGAISWVLMVDTRIVVKIPREPNLKGFAHEIKMYDILEAVTPCPDLMQSFLRHENGNFLPFASGGSLAQRIEANLIRERKPHMVGKIRTPDRVLQILQTEPKELVERWTMELSSAAAWLESLGFAHGDLRPENILLFDDDHLKLTDFDWMTEIGTVVEGSAAPYCRGLGAEADVDRGSYGYHGVRTESFAIGSLVYLMTRGHEPYEMEEWEEGVDSAIEITDRFWRLELPSLGIDDLDEIIRRCWYNKFESLKDLREEAKTLQGAIKLPRAVPLDPDYVLERRKECQKLVEGGIFEDDYFLN